MAEQETDSVQPNPIRSTHPAQEPGWQVLAEFGLPGQPRNDRLAIDQLTAAVRDLTLPRSSLERLKAAVAKATLNAIEHGHKYQSDLPVLVRVLVSATTLLIHGIDQGRGSPISKPESPDLAAPRAGQPSAQGWGFFLIERMIDDLRVMGDEAHYTIELFLYLEGDKYDQ